MVRRRRGAGTVRRIGGRFFTLISVHRKKSTAKTMAKRLRGRAKGNQARVVPFRGEHLVYARGRKL